MIRATLDDEKMWPLLNASPQPACEKIFHMAETKKDLVWIQTAFFMGWGCNACAWKDVLPGDVPTMRVPSR
jgi:hypothetical protein